MEYLGNMFDQSKTSKIYKLYPEFEFPPLGAVEISLMNAYNFSEARLAAYCISQKIEKAVQEGYFPQALNMLYHALRVDPTCVDVWRVMPLVLGAGVDIETKILLQREVLNFAQCSFHSYFKISKGTFYLELPTRPYIRLLHDIGHAAMEIDAIDIAIFAYEESLRLNHNDNLDMRS